VELELERGDVIRAEALSERVRFPAEYAAEARARSKQTSELGWSTTVGHVLHRRHPELDHDDWHRDARFGGVSRRVLVERAIARAVSQAHATAAAAARAE